MLGGNKWALHRYIQSNVEQKYTLMNLLHLVHIEEDMVHHWAIVDYNQQLNT